MKTYIIKIYPLPTEIEVQADNLSEAKDTAMHLYNGNGNGYHEDIYKITG